MTSDQRLGIFRFIKEVAEQDPDSLVSRGFAKSIPQFQ